MASSPNLGRGRVQWSGDLERNLATLDVRVQRAMAATVGHVAPQAEAWMKSSAPWQDRTGNARSGLKAEPQVLGKIARIVFSHSVSYGIWLEVRWSGRYKVIQPAVQHFFPVSMATLNRLLRLR